MSNQSAKLNSIEAYFEYRAQESATQLNLYTEIQAVINEYRQLSEERDSHNRQHLQSLPPVRSEDEKVLQTIQRRLAEQIAPGTLKSTFEHVLEVCGL